RPETARHGVVRVSVSSAPLRSGDPAPLLSSSGSHPSPFAADRPTTQLSKQRDRCPLTWVTSFLPLQNQDPNFFLLGPEGQI
ncbi:mCG141654, partial [Mus musculus]